MGALDGQVALVTGAGAGLGRAHALALAGEGAAVVVNDADAEAAAAVGREVHDLGSRAIVDVHRLQDMADGEAVVARAVAAFGRVDVVVNNAGVSVRSDIVDLTDEHLDLHLGVHLRATIGTTKAALRSMPEWGGGRVINTVSGQGLDPTVPGSSAYATAKAALFGFTRAAAVEGRPLGVIVCAVAPLALTGMSEQYLSGVPDAADRLDPARVARVVAHLASEAAGDVSGHVFRIEGSRVSRYLVSLSRPVDVAGDVGDQMEAVLRA